MKRYFSFIIPVFNRPNEIKELLESFLNLDFVEEYEIVIVEDGSENTSQAVVESYPQLPVSYFYKENSGPGDSRNYGMNQAKGDYFIILDSDCLLPTDYLINVTTFFNKTYVDCFGGPDAAHKDFSDVQKAINYVMTSFFTTGGIRGNKKALQKFEPRSFNMGLSKEAFQKTGGFGKIHPGEDPDLVQRLLQAGFKTAFVSDAYVYHKRRIDWTKFYTQVSKFGLVRPILNSLYPSSSKITFWFPSLFMIFTITALVLIFFKIWYLLAVLGIYLFIIGIDSSVKNKNIKIGLLSIFALFIQFFGYGWSFLKSSFYVGILKKDPKKQFPNLYFK